MESEGSRSYSMKQALEQLHSELSREVESTVLINRQTRWGTWARQFHHGVVASSYHWTTCALASLTILLLIVAYAFTEDKSASNSVWLLVEACVILMSVIFNVYITCVSSSQENLEFAHLLTEILKTLSTCMKYNTWNGSYFPRLESPQSPCYTLQWTLRDGHVYNLPTSLLVKGDIILMRPGHRAPANCSQIQDPGEGGEPIQLKEGDLYSRDDGDGEENVQGPQRRPPLQARRFRMLETPYVKCARQILADADRPSSIIEHEKFIIMSKCIERRIIPAILVVMFITNIVRYLYLRGHVGHWSEILLTLQMQAIIPLISITLPIMWLLINFYGQACVFSAFEAAKGHKSLCEDSFDTDSSISADEARVDLHWRQILGWFKRIVQGNAQVVTRRINITHILGSITTLCCVDKKGILSYPNPTPEKIFFLKREQAEPKTQTSVSPSESMSGQENTAKGKMTAQDAGLCQTTSVEVLDITWNPKKSYGLHFDDPSWKHHLSSLKPLGLTILVNTCNLATAHWYTQFTDHVSCAALENKETVAVVNRRCLCSLAKNMGFCEKALDIFKLEKTLGVYRQVSAEMATKERLQRAKSFIQHKIPMPNMVSVVVKEKVSGSCQLLSQGTADILLNCCSDFWDGEDLAPLTENDRKRIIDFYHRTSIGSYCTAFSYRPVRQCSLGSESDMYIELPDDSRCSHMLDNQLTSGSVDQDMDLLCDLPSLWETPRSFSADSLFDSSSIMSMEDGSSIFSTQCNQIFTGMITMQYQARPDFIQLIDKLEGACIRFVHFSQENEVRSRVFAEKMGLEAGWNCHISLRSEKQYLSGITTNPETSQCDLSHRASKGYSSRHSTESYVRADNPVMARKSKNFKKQFNSRSQSAPSIVNLGSPQVKFEKKVKTAIVSPRKVKKEVIVLSDDESALLTGGSDGVLDAAEEEESEVEMDGGVLDWGMEEGLSRQASSYITDNTEDSLTGALDNRAKLPRGIENIRPHLRSIDNVPLLVNLFTDCTTQTTKEMISIMQEHGEVVLCVGSSVNIQNVPMFLQADCSFSLEPMCPQVCLQQPTSSLLWDHDVPTPLQLASQLLTVMCPIHISKDENISLIHLIAEARSHLMSMQNCFYLMLCCSLSVSVSQVLASLLLFPPVLAPQHVLWLVLVIVPLLGLTMMGNPVDARVMSLATRKNSNHITLERFLQFIVYFWMIFLPPVLVAMFCYGFQMFLQFIVYYLVRFLPPVLVALFCYGFTLHSYCQTSVATYNATTCAIYDFMYTSPSLDRTWYQKFSGGIVLAQNIFLFLLVLYFAVISVSFVHWTDHLWQQLPATNKLWLTLVPVLLCAQLVFCVCDTYVRSVSVSHSLALANIHPAVLATGLAFPIVMVVINELVKHREIKLAVRYQKRARLDFGTKLGMNSPF